MNNLKVKEMIKPFTGENDVETWLTKVDLVMKIHKLKNEAEFIPLFLEEAALAVYLQMSEENKKSGQNIKERLREAFGEDPFAAYQKLTKKKWQGESIDVFATDLNRLARSAGITEEVILKRAFVTGLPLEIGKDLRALNGIELMSMADLVTRARAVTAATQESREVIAAGRQFVQKMNRPWKERPPYRKDINEREVSSWSVICWNCQKQGHIARDCRSRQGNDVDEVGAPGATSSNQ
jgi:hypothetical protein